MEHRNFNSTELQHVELDTHITTIGKTNDLPQKLHFSCSHTCSFSNQESKMLDSSQRSKTAFKLSGLIIFYSIVMVIEIIGGLRANSLAILTDAAHLLSDITGFFISLLAVWISAWEATPQQSFGFSRVEVIGALFSVQLIWLISGTLICEAVKRLSTKNTQVNGEIICAIAAFGFLVNLLLVLWLGHDYSHHGHSCNDEEHGHEMAESCKGDEEESRNLVSPHKRAEMLNINIQGAYLHIMTDLIQSVGVLIAGFIIWLKPEWLVVDLICTIVFAAIALGTTLPMLKNVFSILMERAPSEIDVNHIVSGIKVIRGVNDVHDLHIWGITVGKCVLACHVVIGSGFDGNEILVKVREHCERVFGIHHATIQIEQEL